VSFWQVFAEEEEDDEDEDEDESFSDMVRSNTLPKSDKAGKAPANRFSGEYCCKGCFLFFMLADTVVGSDAVVSLTAAAEVMCIVTEPSTGKTMSLLLLVEVVVELESVVLLEMTIVVTFTGCEDIFLSRVVVFVKL
jgi:hypothetical protein